MKKLRITQIRSQIDRPQVQKRTITALGIKKLNRPIEVEATPQILGMIDTVKHLLKVEEI
ncbi:MAG TPA: 50S ribosomal protein L30 [Bacteroidales bacterium]|jgi:large subunit ribosomal protein L30|nr:50S ribosomal protein L30 [Bacteroidales bacterium]OQA85144.1 MAG: 50S ribosomal protein L30 [Bacteroidetes bacterium ADurb.Bin234]HOS17425.1 50S ribosomal protein L30 [Bacteroidales bacterium]